MKENTARKLILAFLTLAIVSILAVVLYPLLTGNQYISSERVYDFEGLKGPNNNSYIKEQAKTNWQKYQEGSNSRLAILLTDTNSAWLGLVHGLKTIGVPFRVTTDIDEALKHKVVLAYPVISGKTMSAKNLKKLADFVHRGGHVIATNVLGGGLQALFGFKAAQSSRDHYQLVLQAKHPVTQIDAVEAFRRIRISTKQPGDLSFGTYSYSEPKHTPIAVYDDGTAAIVYNKFLQSKVYAIGFDIGFYLLKAYNRRMEGVADTYANGFEASVDNLLKFIKSIYLQHESSAITIGTVPEGKSLSVILSHDIDYNRSLKNAQEYARHQQASGITATHFIQTKYISDWNDMIFFDEENIEYLKNLKSMGIELASHSVSHSRMFEQFKIGIGDETYPEYKPFVQSKETTYNGTILGELRVSKFLIEHFSKGKEVISFRPGHLSNPVALPQALQASGYQYSSSVTANVSLSHLPFQLNHNRDINSEIDIFEFPITVEDELPPKMGDRISDAIELADKISRYGGLFVVLIHPDVLDHKLGFQQEFVEKMKPRAWFGSIREFGDWWAARNSVEIDVMSNGNKREVTLHTKKPIKNLVLNIPNKWRLESPIKAVNNISQANNVISIKYIKNKIVLSFEL